MNRQRPRHIDPYADECLRALVREGLGAKISLGGAFGLSYYIEYRATHDVDAWWSSDAGESERRKIVSLIRETLNKHGIVEVRTWGDVVSIELQVGDRVVFAFQIASRSAQLENPQPAPWPDGVLLDSFPDLVAAKMTALVERGAPRDFRDIYAVCNAGLADEKSCWDLWERRARLAGDDTSKGRARLAVLTHLERIESHRPLGGIPDPREREQAAALRAWFRGRFLDALMD
jgi:hypothetical protein